MVTTALYYMVRTPRINNPYGTLNTYCNYYMCALFRSCIALFICGARGRIGLFSCLIFFLLRSDANV